MSLNFDLYQLIPQDSSYNFFFDENSEPDSLIQFYGQNRAVQSMNQIQKNLPILKKEHIMEITTPSKPKSKKIQKMTVKQQFLEDMDQEIKPQKSNRKRQIKASPYHNYQKHLNVALKHLIQLPPLSTNPSSAIVTAHQLWQVFQTSESSTKKILHFIFNEFNQHRIREGQLEEFGFQQVYASCSHETLGEAKTYLTNIAVEQMTDERIGGYLETRRIKNPMKFRRYIQMFRREMQDGFLKKRFTNRNRKEQRRKEIEKQLQ